MKRIVSLFLPLVLALACMPAFPALSVDTIFDYRIAIQRKNPVVLIGSSAAGKSVTVTFGQDSTNARASGSGCWFVKFPARQPTTAPAKISVSVDVAGSALVLKNLLVAGEWVAAGQSNMAPPLGRDLERGAELQATANDAVDKTTFSAPSVEVDAKPLDHAAVKLLEPDRPYACAVGEAFTRASSAACCCARKARAATVVPISIAGYSIGGAALATFGSMDALRTGGFGKKLCCGCMQNQELADWVRTRAEQSPADEAGGPADALGRNHTYKPALAWAADMGRSTAFPVRDFLRHQSECNAIGPTRAAEYLKLQRVMAANWRVQWGDEKLPFYFAQPTSCKSAGSSHRGEFCDLQHRAVEQSPAPSGIAVTYDFGPPPTFKGDVHLKQIRPVGERLALLALRDVYGSPSLVAESAAPPSASKAGGGIWIRFRNAASLRANSGDVAGFEISAGSTQFVPAVATIKGDSVALRAEAAATPTAVR